MKCERVAALVVSILVPLALLAWLATWKPAVRIKASASPALQVAWIVRAPSRHAAAVPALASRSRERRPSASVAPRRPRASAQPPQLQSQPSQEASAKPFDLGLPDVAPMSFTPDPIRRPTRALDAPRKLHFAMRDDGPASLGIARDCAELRAALATRESTETILRSMRERGCTL